MVVFHIDFPFQPVIPFVVMEKRHLVAPAGRRVVQVDGLHFPRPYIQIRNRADVWQVGRSTQAESRDFFHAAVAYIYERCAGRGIGQPMAVAVMIDNGKLPASLIVAFAQGELIDFRPVLILGKTQFERSRIEVLVNAATIEPVLP